MPPKGTKRAAAVAVAEPASAEEEVSADEAPAAKSPKKTEKSGDAPVKRGRGRPPMSAEKRAKKEAAKAAKGTSGPGKRGRPKAS